MRRSVSSRDIHWSNGQPQNRLIPEDGVPAGTDHQDLGKRSPDRTHTSGGSTGNPTLGWADKPDQWFRLTEGGFHRRAYCKTTPGHLMPICPVMEKPQLVLKCALVLPLVVGPVLGVLTAWRFLGSRVRASVIGGALGDLLICGAIGFLIGATTAPERGRVLNWGGGLAPGVLTGVLSAFLGIVFGISVGLVAAYVQREK